MIRVEDGRVIKVVVTGIRSAGSPGHYVVDMEVNSMARSFEFSVAPRPFFCVTTERSFDDIFGNTLGGNKIVDVIFMHHNSQPIDYPVDIGEVLDFKHLLAAGGPDAAHRRAKEHEPDSDEDDE